MEVKRNGTQPSQKGPEEYFMGSARIDTPLQGSAPARAGGAIVSPPPARGPASEFVNGLNETAGRLAYRTPGGWEGYRIAAMTITIDLPPDVEESVRLQAAQYGLPVEAYVGATWPACSQKKARAGDTNHPRGHQAS